MVPLSAVVVEDNASLREVLLSALRGVGFEDVRAAASVDEFRQLLLQCQPSLILLDVKLPDGDAFDVLANFPIEFVPFPAIVALSGAASQEEAFRLAGLGVRHYLQKPIDLERLEKAILSASTTRPSIKDQLLPLLGNVPLLELEAEVRAVMVEAALKKTRGNRRGAARLLSVSRQVLQHMLRRLGAGRPAE